MKSKKLISLLCAAALTASTFAAFAVTANAAAGDKIGSDLLNLNFNSTTNFAAADPADEKYDGVLANGTSTGSVTVPILADGTAVKTLGEGQTAALTLVTGSRGSGDRGWYTDSEGELVKNGSWYAVEEKTTGDNYLHMNYPTFGDYESNGRYAHVDFPATYTATADKDYVVEFKARFISGTKSGEVSTENPYNPVLRIGTFTAKPANAVEINKRELEIGDDWVTVKAVTSLKGTKVYLNGSETYSATSTTATSISGFGLYSEDGKTNVPVPLDIKGDSLAANAHTLSPAVDIDDLVIYEAEPEKEVDVTINYVDENDTAITGKASVTLTGIVGKQFTVPASYKADFEKDADQYYTYTSGGDTAITVVDGTNTINLKFTATDKPTITLNAVNAAGTVITKLDEAKAMPGATATLYSKEYVKGSDDKYYQKNDGAVDSRNNPVYGKTVTGTAENQTVTVVYKPAYDVVYYKEGEDFEGASTDESSVYYSSGNYPLTGASGGLRATIPLGDATYPAGYMTDVLPEGEYEITVSVFDSDGKRGIPVGTLLDSDVAHVTKIGEVSGVSVLTKSFTATLTGTNAKFYVGKCNAQTVEGSSNRLNAPLDYIVVKDTSLDAAPVPEVTIGNTSNEGGKDVIELTLTNKEEFAALGINPTVTLIQAVYDSNNALTGTKIFSNIEIDSATGTVNADIDDATKLTSSVFYVWDTVGGVRPLGAAKTVTVGGAI